MRLIAYLAFLCLWLNFAAPAAHAQQLQAFAQQRYNEYNNYRIATWHARAQGQPEYVINQHLANERAAWDAFTQANNWANAEVNRLWTEHYVAQVDNTIAGWQNYIQAIYNGRNVNRYATDYAYRVWWDSQTQGPLAYAAAVIAQQSAYRQQLVGAQIPPQPLSHDPRYATADGSPIADSWKKTLTNQ